MRVSTAAAAFVVVVGMFPLAGCRNGISKVRIVVRNAGSDTMVNLAQAWAEEYARVRPDVSIEVAGGGSGTGIAALIDGSADLANTSRRIEPAELAAALSKRGKRPREWVVGHDALAVYVHPANPLRAISIPQLARLYGRDHPASSWPEIGVTIPGVRSQEIILISRQSNSGTYHYFRRSLLGKTGDFRLGTRDLNGSKEVVSLVASTRGAIGYSGMGYATPGVRALAVSRGDGHAAVLPSAENVISGAYPLSRPLYIYSLGDPAGAVKDYIDWIESDAGQRVVAAAGYVPMFESEKAAREHAP
jgi:phosphate transport system substrate-binding protein